MKPKVLPRVVILTSTIPQALLEMMDGFLRYAQEHGPWRIYQQERRRWTNELKDWQSWGCSGIVAGDRHTVEDARAIAAAGVPVVVLLQSDTMRRRDFPLWPYPCVLWDSDAIGRMAAGYFVGRGYRNFAFAGVSAPGVYWSEDRGRVFHAALRRAGFKDVADFATGTRAEQDDWALESVRMRAWLRTLPKPVAVFAPNDRRGKQVLDACLDEGLAVPEEVSVLGVDDDRWICEASVPTLSSIRCLSRQAGAEIAGVLDRMMAGEKPRHRDILLEPVCVETRQSTDWQMSDDTVVRGVLHDIAERAAHPELDVPQICRRAGVSRRGLEIRFRRATGRTIREEIERVRLENLKAVMLETDDRLEDLVLRCGFASFPHACRLFRARCGTTMRAFRRQKFSSQTVKNGCAKRH